MFSYIKKIKKQNVVILVISLAVFMGNVMSTSLNPVTFGKKSADEEKKFAGSASCSSCHKEIYKSHIQTAHYHDSRPASKESIKGSFARGRNNFIYNRFTKVLLEQKKDQFFQAALINEIEFQREPFDIVIGSGRKGQTYLYWKNNDLFQLPVSYYTALNSWCNSPGFPTAYVRFDRPITTQCLECHTTYVKENELSGNLNSFDKNKIIYGVDCERCHGPAADHVAFHKEKPNEKKAQFIINSKTMNRQQRLDACALCHSGFRNAIKPPLSFMVGDKLDDFSSAGYSADSVATLDVHGNQYGLLTSSKCFKMSLQLDCSSCHNVHINEVNSPKIFSQRCMNCHSEKTHNNCKMQPVKGLSLNENCIDCHMPLLPSQAIQLNVGNADKPVPDLLRTHRVAIYEEKTKEYIDNLRTVLINKSSEK